jgi:outer membrane protein TolC
MMHWKPTIGGLALLFAALALAGCSKPCCLQDYDEFCARAGVPADLPCNADISNQLTSPNPSRAPRTILDADGEPNYITLSECIALALENGTVGSQSLRTIFNAISILNTGTVFFGNTDDMVSFSGAGAVGSDAIRVFALQPAIVQTDIEASLSRYDTVARSFLGFNTVNQPENNSISNGQFARFGVGLEKALPTGGVAGITFGNNVPGTLSNGDFLSGAGNFYNNFVTPNSLAGTANGYTPDLHFGFSQPLLKFFGPDINALLPTHPLSPSQQLIGTAAATAPPIVIARINFNQSRAEFERLVNYMVLNVEVAYYQLYALYVNLYATEQAMRQSHAVWKISKAKYEAGQVAVTGFAQTRGQYEDFRAQRIQALSKVLEQERILRVLCGLPLEDCKRLVPVDTPTLAPYRPDWCSALDEAMRLRPELVIAREDVKRRQLELQVQLNGLLPDVRLEGGYVLHGFGSRLDGDGAFTSGFTDNALRSLSDTHFTDYNIGIVGNIPLGFRAQHASVRAANLKVMQAYLVLRDQEIKARNNLCVAYRQVYADYEVIIARRAQREADAEQVEARFKEYLAGKTTVDFLLTAQQQWAAALSQEYQAITNYNFDLAAFQFAKGTLLRHNNIDISEAPLPQCIQVRAVENERQRAKAIVCRERNEVVPCQGPVCPDLPGATAPSLPSLMMDQKMDDRVPADRLEEPAPNRAGSAIQVPTETSSPPPATSTPATETAPPAMPLLPTAPALNPAPSSGLVIPPPPPGLDSLPMTPSR